MEQMDLYDKLREVPENAQKSIKGGRLNGFTDINAMWRIEKLTEVFGPCGFGWMYEIKDQRLVPGANDEVKAFVDIELRVKMGSEWSEPIPGIGGSTFISKERNGLFTSDECFKMALTDAIGVAAKALGLGADIYRGCDRSKYSSYEEEPVRPQPSELQRPPVQTRAPEPMRPQDQMRMPEAAPPPQRRRETPPPPDINPGPMESADGYYYCEKCGEPIGNWKRPDGGIMYPKEIAALSLQKFGRQLCPACGNKR